MNSIVDYHERVKTVGTTIRHAPEFFYCPMTQTRMDSFKSSLEKSNALLLFFFFFFFLLLFSKGENNPWETMWADPNESVIGERKRWKEAELSRIASRKKKVQQPLNDRVEGEYRYIYTCVYTFNCVTRRALNYVTHTCLRRVKESVIINV